ncbi:STT3 domain-containing protein [Nitratifractor sp.]|uniref:STT3 domain-containing protein n=1 Tax=Nitratifractor sp. TaxID=2268144 RepID=UPI0025D3A483|nr:STT3 domain-containing protein [Nitratifractor sp.]
MKNRESEFLKVEEGRFSTGTFVLLLLIAYSFAVAVRYLWIHWAGTHPEFLWHGQVMINTNDGYYWAEGARDILAGHHQPHDLSPVEAPLAILTAWLARVLPFSFETIILWMPALFGSLLVVPMMLIGRVLRLDWVGFLAAMLAGIVWSYYNRTMAGYYDTDMLTIVLPTFVLYGMIKAVVSQKNRYMILTAFMMLFYTWWYPAAEPLNTAFAAIVLIYTLIFDRKNPYLYKLLLFMLVALLPLGWMVDGGLATGLYLFFHFGKQKADRLIFPLLLIAAAAFVGMGGLDPIWFQIRGYLFRESVAGGTGTSDLHFYAVSKTVREAGKIPFEIFADRISGDPVLFVLSLIGYLLFALRYPVMWLALPMMGLGFLAMKGGLRFTVYAVPPMALGMGYATVWFSQRLAGVLAGERWQGQRVARFLSLLILAAVLYPNIRHISDYKVPTVFSKPEVEVLDRLKKIAQREDYVLAWWDYGYPIRYYSDVKTLIDGGKHSGDVNFPVSFALTRPQLASARMARLDTEYTEQAYTTQKSGSYLAMMMRDYNLTDPEEFLIALGQPIFKLPSRSRNVYYYLPYRMMGIYPTIEFFSRLDLKTGTPSRQSTFYQINRFARKGNLIIFGQDAFVDLKSGTVTSGKKHLPLSLIAVTQYDANGKLHKKIKRYPGKEGLYLIDMRDYHKILLLDERAYRSAYVQLFVLENNDPDLFEPVILTPMAKVYRLKK